MSADALVARRVSAGQPFTPDGRLTFSKVDGVFKSGNATRDTIPTHLIVGKDVTADVAQFYAHMCPAGVYEVVGREPANQPAELYRLQSNGCVGTSLDPEGRRQRAEVQADVATGPTRSRRG